MAQLVRSEHRDGIAVLMLARPEKLNAINKAMIGELDQALDAAETDGAVRAVVIGGEGRAFSAGFDLDMETGGAPGPIEVRAALHDDFRIIMRFWDCPKPTIAAVHGYCLGSAMELAMACDITLSTQECRFGAPEVKFGSGIVAMLAPWLAGPKHAKYLLLSGDDRITAQQALEMGLVNRLVVGADPLADALAVAKRIAANDVNAVRLTKQAINRSFDIAGFRQALEQSLELDCKIETSETAESRQFNEILRRDGAKAAIAWRSARAGSQTGDKDHG